MPPMMIKYFFEDTAMRDRTTETAWSPGAVMPAIEVKARLKRDADLVEECLNGVLRLPQVPAGLLEAMEYSLLGGGKRLRPVLCLTTARLFGLDAIIALPFACALECIHTYSLIHDDLPAMDNDDLRRGKPTSHKRFDEATAILAGDGLMTDAVALMCEVDQEAVPAERLLRAIALAVTAAGSPGMVGGQFLDMFYTGKGTASVEELAAMHAQKTGALLRAACLCGAILAGADIRGLEAVSEYGARMGAAFQIVDDILDVIGDEAELGKPVGSDVAQGKITYPSLIGLEESRKRAWAEHDAAVRAIAELAGEEAALLRGLAAYMLNRVS
jgi:geranylgeranyl diphosphate synthase type II